MDGISTNLEELKQQRSTAMKKQNQIFQELESENEKLLILEKEAAKLSSKQERMKEDFESKIDYMWETYEITYNQAFTLKHYEVRRLISFLFSSREFLIFSISFSIRCLLLRR